MSVSNRYSSATPCGMRMQRQRSRQRRLALVALLTVCGTMVWLLSGIVTWRAEVQPISASNAVQLYTTDSVAYRRLLRSAIPQRRFDIADCRSFFRDINDTHLDVAKALGVEPVGDEAWTNVQKQLVSIRSNSYYYVDYMQYSKPNLVPEACMLLQYIGMRFDEILAERGISGIYRPIVTSGFRTAGDVRRLQRVNGNASSQSCHCYGTTFDITYARFCRGQYEMVDDSEAIYNRLFDALACAVYELRYEDLCYVTFESRQNCFHITVRNVEYGGTAQAEVQQFEVSKGLCVALNHNDTLPDALADDFYADAIGDIPSTAVSDFLLW